MRVAHIKSPFLPLTETFIYNYLSSLKRYKPYIIAEYQQNDEVFPVNNIITHRSENLFFESFLKHLRNWLYSKTQKELFFKNFYCNALKTVQADLVHIHFGAPAILLSKIVYELKIPFIVSFYGYDLSSMPYTLGKDIYTKNNLFKIGKFFTVEGKHAMKSLIKLGCPKEKIYLLRIGINIKNYKFLARVRSKSEQVKLLFCGRFVAKKGLILLLEAILRVRNKGIDVCGNIIGFGPLEEEAKSFVKINNLQDNINFLGMFSQKDFINECYKNHIFIAPSQMDEINKESEGGAPTVILEAQATGMPVIGSSHADIPNILQNNKSGMIFNEGSIDDLRDAIIEMSKKDKSWPMMGKNGRAFVKKYHNIDVVGKELERLYDKAR